MKKTALLAALFGAILIAAIPAAYAGSKDAAKGKDKKAAGRVFFKNLKDGQTVTSPVKIEMGVEGMTLAKAGEAKPNEGHHHVIIDGGPIKKGEAVPGDAKHIHYGAGQSEAIVPLTPGKHKLTLQFADGAHKSYGKKMAASLHVIVK